MRLAAISILVPILIYIVHAKEKCIWAIGAVKCIHNPEKQDNVEVRVYDRDGFSILKIFDADDLMGVTFTEKDGSFKVDGCGSDFNFFPGLPNLPDPYIRITHYCNSAEGETIELPEFYTFVPQTHDAGIIELDKTNAIGIERVQESKKSVVFRNRPSHTASNDMLLKLLPEHEDHRSAADRATTISHIDSNEESGTTKENDLKLQKEKITTIGKSNQASAKWKYISDRDRYTLGNAESEITTVTLPDTIVFEADGGVLHDRI